MFGLPALAQNAPATAQQSISVCSYLVPEENEAKARRLIEGLAQQIPFRQIYDRAAGKWIVVAPAAVHDPLARQLTPVGQPITPKKPAEVAAPFPAPLRAGSFPLRTPNG